MSFEIPVDLAYFRHPKTLRLQALLGKKYQADVFPLRLWAWAAEYARDGQVMGGKDQIEAACSWKGTGGRLVSALIEAGFVEVDGKTIHDWKKHIGGAIAIYEAKKRKQKQEYWKKKGILPEENDLSSGNPIRDTLLNPGGDTKSELSSEKTPPKVPTATTPEPAKTEPSARGPETPPDLDLDALVSAIRLRDPSLPPATIKREIARAGRAGVSPERLLEDLTKMGDRLKLWAIVDLYEHPSRKNWNGAAEPPRVNQNPAGHVPPVLAGRREVVQARQDKARAEADERLAGMDPDELHGWTLDAEAEADKAGVETIGREAFVKGVLRRRIAEAFSIEGV